jgi:hypothetical protein
MPYDPEQVARQRSEVRQMGRESAKRQAGAGASPLKSSGGGGFEAGPSSAAPKIKPGPDPTFDKTTGGAVVVPPGTKPRTTQRSFGPGDV